MTGTIYFIQAKRGGPIKIGYTAGDPKRRLSTLQTSSPERLNVIASCPGTIEAERQLHVDLKGYRLVGEWFKDCEPVRAAMRAALGGSPAKPRARRRPCGCVVGYSFCDAADEAWRAVGLARARDDHEGFVDAIKLFGDHLTPPRRYQAVAA